MNITEAPGPSAIAFVVAMLVGANGDVSMAPNMAPLGRAGMLLSLAMTIAGRSRQKRLPKPWPQALFCNALVVFVGLGVIDFAGFAGGGH